MKYRFSKNYRLFQILSFGMAGYFSFLLYNELTDKHHSFDSELAILFSVLIFLFTLIPILLTRVTTYSFSSDGLHIDKVNREIKVPFSEILEIKETIFGISINGFIAIIFWKIKYLTDEGKLKTAWFSPQYFSGHFDEFIQIVQKENAEVIIK